VLYNNTSLKEKGLIYLEISLFHWRAQEAFSQVVNLLSVLKLSGCICSLSIEEFFRILIINDN